MAIEFVGGVTGTNTNGGNVALDLTALTGGLATSPSTDDIVLVFGAVPTNTAGIDVTGYTSIDEGVNSASTGRSILAYKVMTATPDTSVTFVGDGDAKSSVGALAVVWRFVDTADPFAAVATTATGSSTDPNPAAITADTVESATAVFAFSFVNDATITVPSNYGNLVSVNAGADTNDVSLAAAWRGGMRNGIAEDPGAFTTWTTGSWRAVTVALKPAATDITFVGSLAGVAIDGGNVTIDLTALVGGTGGSPIAGDIVILSGGFQDAADAGASTAGYTEVVDHINTVQQSVSWKIMGGTPDTSVVGLGSGSATDGAAYVAHVFRGVDPTTPMDATSTLATGSSTTPDSPSITTVTDGAVVMSTVAHAQTSSGTVLRPLHYSKDGGGFSGDTAPTTAVTSWRTKRLLGAENPPVWSGFASASVWAAATIALRPILPPVVGPGPQGIGSQFVAFHSGTIDPTMHKIESGIAA